VPKAQSCPGASRATADDLLAFVAERVAPQRVCALVRGTGIDERVRRVELVEQIPSRRRAGSCVVS
jgi:hypothetical protein